MPDHAKSHVPVAGSDLRGHAPVAGLDLRGHVAVAGSVHRVTPCLSDGHFGSRHRRACTQGATPPPPGPHARGYATAIVPEAAGPARAGLRHSRRACTHGTTPPPPGLHTCTLTGEITLSGGPSRRRTDKVAVFRKVGCFDQCCDCGGCAVICGVRVATMPARMPVAFATLVALQPCLSQGKIQGKT